MKNILFIPSDNSSSSGAFRSMAKLAQLLVKDHGYNVYIILRKKGDTGAKLLDEYGLEYEFIESYNWAYPMEWNPLFTYGLRVGLSLFNKLAIRKIQKVIRDRHIDLVHINTTYSYVGAIAAKRENVPVVWHIREFLEEDQYRKIWSKNGLRLIGQSNAIVAISDEIKAKYTKLIPEGKIVRIFNGIDESDFYEENRQILEGDTTSLICVGHIAKGKRQDMVIRACKILEDKGITNWNLTFVGFGDKEEEFKQLTRDLGLDSKIVFAGFQRDVVPFYKKADILVMSSSSEAFGRVTVEAMMAGCLIVGSASGATPAVLDYGKAGYLFDSNSDKALADRLMYVMEHKSQAKEMAAAGQKRAMNEYRASVNAKHIAELYKAIEEGRDFA